VKDESLPTIAGVEGDEWAHMSAKGCLGRCKHWFTTRIKSGELKATRDWKRVRVRVRKPNSKLMAYTVTFVRRAVVQRLKEGVEKLPTIGEIEKGGEWVSASTTGHHNTLALWRRNGTISKRDTRVITVRMPLRGTFGRVDLIFHRRKVVERL